MFRHIPGLGEILARLFGHHGFVVVETETADPSRKTESALYQLVTDSRNESGPDGQRYVQFIIAPPGGVMPTTPVRVNASRVPVSTSQEDGLITITVQGNKLVTYDVVAETRPGRIVVDVVPTKVHVKVTIRLPKGSQCVLAGGQKAAVMLSGDVRKIGLQMGLLPRDPFVIRKEMKMVHVSHIEQLARERGFVTRREALIEALRSGWEPPKDSCPFDVFGSPSIVDYNAALAEFDAAVAAKQAASAPATSEEPTDSPVELGGEPGNGATDAAAGSNGEGADDSIHSCAGAS